MVSLPNWLPPRFRPAGREEWLTPDSAEVLDHRHVQHLSCGLLERRTRYGLGDGRVLVVRQQRPAHLADPHLAVLRAEFTAEGLAGELEVEAALDGGVTNSGVARYRDLDGRHPTHVHVGSAAPDTVWLRCRTRTSDIRIAMAARLTGAGPVSDAHRAGCTVGRTRLHLAPPSVPCPSTRPSPCTPPVTPRSATRCARPWTGGRRARLGRAAGVAPDGVGPTVAAGRAGRARGGGPHPAAAPLPRAPDSPRTPPTPTSGCPRGDCTGRPVAGTFSGTSCSCCRIPTCTSRRSHAPCWATATTVWPRPARSAGAARRAVPVAERQRRPRGDAGTAPQPALGRRLPDRSRLQHRVGSAIAYNVWRYCEAGGDTEFLHTKGRRTAAGDRPLLGRLRRLDRILEAEGDTVNRYRASEQADVLMLGCLFSPAELRSLLGRLGHLLDNGQWQRAVEHCLRRTSHGSTVSGLVHGWVLARGPACGGPDVLPGGPAR